MANVIYLSKDGKSSGPFTELEFQAIRDRGELTQYTHIWDGSSSAWKELAPPPPPGAAPSHASTPNVSAPAVEIAPVISLNKRSQLTVDASRIQAVCHNLVNVLNGKLERVSETGCEFVCTDSHESGSSFAKDCKVTLNLLDSQKGRSMNVSAKLMNVVRKNGNWTYELQWKRCPEIVL